MSFAKKHAFWLAPLLGFFGFLSYFLIFAKYPAFRDLPVLNLVLVVVSVALATVGLRSVRGANWKRKAIHSLGLLFSIGCAAMLFFYVFGISYQMPEPTTETLALESAPDFSLTDANGQVVSLASFRGKKVVLSFFRGFW